MTQKSIKRIINGKYSKPPKKNYATKKTDVYHIDDIWSSNILDLKGCGPENNRIYRYVLVIMDNFSNFGWTVPLKNKNAQTKNYSFEFFLISSKKPNLIETDRGKEFYNSIFQNFLINKIITFYSRNTYVGAVYAERFNCTTRDILEKPVFEEGESNWIDVLHAITKQYNNRIQSLIKLTPIQASFEKIEGYVYKSFLDKLKKVKRKFQVSNVVRTSDLKHTFSK